MKKYFAPELETAKFTINNVIATSTQDAADIIGGNKEEDNLNDYSGVITFDWGQANWD